MTYPQHSYSDIRLAEALDMIEHMSKNRGPAVSNFLKIVKDVVIIASSSRGGSSVFTEILRQSPDLIHFRAEINPFLLIAGLTYPENGAGSDMLKKEHLEAPNHEKLRVLEREMALDAGNASNGQYFDSTALLRFANDLVWRLFVQWPTVSFETDLLYSCIDETFQELYSKHGWEKGQFKDTQLFHALFMSRIISHFPDVNPYYYDLNPALIKKYCPDSKINYGPPSPFIIEEPPFVLNSPWKPASYSMLNSQPLIIKTPSNVYRLAFLRSLFSEARFRILHLTRNPAASINGLYDGWRHNGFFAHKVSKPLNIHGYTDIFPEWGKSWWKFDLPPGWESRTEWQLENICGFQWRSAHQAILDYLEKNNTDTFKLRFEDVIGPGEIRERRFEEVAEWLGIDSAPLIKTVSGEIPPVMSTSRPRLRRWFKKAELLSPVLEEPRIKDTVERLGYEFKPEEWI